MESDMETSRPQARRTPARSKSTASRKVFAMSAVSNGHRILPDIDGRSMIARRYRDIASQIVSDQGGSDLCSESRLQLIRRFAAASVLAEELEAKLARGEQIDVSEHALLCSTLTRLASRIGVERRSKDETPSLQQNLRQRNEIEA